MRAGSGAGPGAVAGPAAGAGAGRGDASRVPSDGRGRAPQRAAPGQLGLRADPVVREPRGNLRAGGDQPAPGQLAELERVPGQVEQQHAVGRGAVRRHRDRARARGGQQPAAVRRGHLPAAGQRADPVARRRPAGRRPVRADPQHAVQDGPGGPPGPPGGPSAPAARAPAARPRPARRARRARQLNVHGSGVQHARRPRSTTGRAGGGLVSSAGPAPPGRPGTGTARRGRMPQ